MLAHREISEENEVIKAKALEGTKKKKRANKPNEFITNDDFCPGCSLRLKSLPDDQNLFWTEIFQRELNDGDDIPMAGAYPRGKPGVLLFRGWGLESRVGASVQTQMSTLKKDIEEHKKKLHQYPYIHGVEDSAHPVDLQLAIRGNPLNLGPSIPRHFLSIFSEGDPKPFSQGSGRLELAEDIVKQPIAMRVIVNRIWKAHFDTGIVDTPSNFGAGGERPTDPALLDYLAEFFVRNGMSLKKLHREIMLSSVYQLSTDNDEADSAKDSGNRFYWRANRKRLDAEQLRDSVLLVSGNLDTALGGPSEELTPANTRRTVYGHVSRYKLDQYLQTFDFPAPNISAEKRFTTTVPLQRLFLMNSDFMQIEAEDLAKRVAGEPDNRARIRKIYQLAYGREPSEMEIKLGIDYLHAEPMREYNEGKKKSEEESVGKGQKDGMDAPSGAIGSLDSKPAPDATAQAIPPAADSSAAGGVPPAADANADMGMGMMAGVPGFGKRAPKVVKYEPTPWGRYAKILLSSSEFLFIN
jgi:hypothetical protein